MQAAMLPLMFGYATLTPLSYFPLVDFLQSVGSDNFSIIGGAHQHHNPDYRIAPGLDQGVLRTTKPGKSEYRGYPHYFLRSGYDSLP
jgi:hypothetical protein